jgi:hypothetical protein
MVGHDCDSLSLKEGHEQPEIEQAITTGSDRGVATGADDDINDNGDSLSSSMTPADMLRLMPGVTPDNIKRIMKEAGSLYGLTKVPSPPFRPPLYLSLNHLTIFVRYRRRRRI